MSPDDGLMVVGSKALACRFGIACASRQGNDTAGHAQESVQGPYFLVIVGSPPSVSIGCGDGHGVSKTDLE